MALMGAAAIGTILGSLMTIAIGRAKAERVGGGGGGSIDVGGVEREKETGRVGGSWLLGAFGCVVSFFMGGEGRGRSCSQTFP